MKETQVLDYRKGQLGVGDVWTWVAIDADTRLVISYLVGSRDGMHAAHFISDVAGRLANRDQLTTDGHKPYLEAVEGAFGGEIDYAVLVNKTLRQRQPKENSVPMFPIFYFVSN